MTGAKIITWTNNLYVTREQRVISLGLCDTIWCHNLVNIAPGNVLLPGHIKALPEPMLANPQGVLWHLTEDNFTVGAQTTTILQNEQLRKK